MTLILSAMVKNLIVVGADGAEFHHTTGQPDRMAVTNRRKLIPLGRRPIVFAAHGQNQITTLGATLDNQRQIGEILAELTSSLMPVPTVEGVASRVFEALSPRVEHTFTLLQSGGIHLSALAITVYGFDKGKRRAQCFEAFWPIRGSRERGGVLHKATVNDEFRVMHSGSGAEHAEAIVRDVNGPFHPNRFRVRTVLSLQKYVRSVYDAAKARQSQEFPVFGGQYHEVTISPDGWEWSVSPEAKDLA